MCNLYADSAQKWKYTYTCLYSIAQYIVNTVSCICVIRVIAEVAWQPFKRGN